MLYTASLYLVRITVLADESKMPGANSRMPLNCNCAVQDAHGTSKPVTTDKKTQVQQINFQPNEQLVRQGPPSD